MTISRRSWRCLSRRALARISIIVRLGLSSMNSGAPETSPILRASLFQSSSLIWPLRMWLSGIFASADSSRMVISLRVISRLKMTLTSGRGGSRPTGRGPAPASTCPTAGRAATITIWPPCNPLVSSSRSAKPVGTPVMLTVAVGDRLDLVERGLHDRAERRVVLRGPLVGDLVDLLLGGVDDVVDVALAGVPHLHDPGARRRPGGAGSPSRARSRRSSRRWPRSGPLPTACGGTARRPPGPARRDGCSSAEMVTGSTGSPRP